MSKATKSVGKAVNKGLHKATKAFSGLSNILHESEHEPIYNSYSKAEQEEAAYYGHHVKREEPASTTPYRQPIVRSRNSDPYVPTVTHHMTSEERKVEAARAEQFHEWPKYTVEVPDQDAPARMEAALMRRNTEARLGLDKAPPKTILRSMSDSEIEIEKARAMYKGEEPRFDKVVDHEAMRAHATLQRRTAQLLKPPFANAMQSNMTILLEDYNIVDITKFKPDQFVGMMVDLTSQTKYADATRVLIHNDNELGIKLQERWLNLRSLQMDARKSNVHAGSIKWLMENHTEAVIKYLGSGSDRAANKLLKLINS